MHVFEVFMQKMRYRLLIEYDGYKYAGWQVQKGQRTVQGEIERALHTILKNSVGITGGGRTDTGVHARGQTAHFDFNYSQDCARLRRSLNGILDSDIRIIEVAETAPDFHARYSAKEREYRYYIARKPVAIQRAYCWYCNYRLDVKRMRQAAALVEEVKDFKAFARTGSDVKHTICNVKEASFKEQKDILIFTIIYAALYKSKILGEDRKNFNVIIALVVALSVIIPHVLGTYPAGYDIRKFRGISCRRDRN